MKNSLDISDKNNKYQFCISQVSLALGLDASSWSALVERSASGIAGIAGLAQRCGVCLATFPDALLLQRHAILQHANPPGDDKPFTCEQCGQRYRYRSAYVKHREQNHRARLPADKLFTCEVCGMQFRYLKSFKKHRLNHHLERLQRTPESLRTSTAERSDQVSSTGEPLQMETGSDASPVDVEDRSGENSENTCKEEIVSETASPQRNNENSDTIAGNGTGINEIREHDNGNLDDEVRPEPIEATINLARAHESDRRERRFACPFCGKCVRSKENLKLHVRKHTGERPFVCLFCGRAFGGKSDLTRHLRIHTGERPYHCEMCGKCFARADYLSKHLTTHIHQR